MFLVGAGSALFNVRVQHRNKSYRLYRSSEIKLFLYPSILIYPVKDALQFHLSTLT